MAESDPREEEGVRERPARLRTRRLFVPAGISPGFRAAAAFDRLWLGAGAWLEREIEAGRGFSWLPVAFGIGALIYFALPSEPSLLALAGLATLLWGLAFARRHRTASVRLLIVLAMAASGATAIKLRTDTLATRVLERQVTGTVIGWVEERKARRGGYRLTIRVESLDAKRVTTVPQRVTVTVRGKAAPEVGDGIKVLARLRPASGPVLPGGYDFARDSYYRGIGATGFGYGVAQPADIGPPPLSIRLREPLEAIREAVRARIVANLDGESRYIASALILGDAGGLAEKTEDDLRLSGLAHVLSVSGLHMVLVTGVTFWGVRAGLALIPSLALRRPIKKWAAIAALLVSGFYLLISGLDVAAQRSFIMTSIVFLAILVDRRAISMRNVALAGLVVLALTPESILSASFQMSFAATIALVAGFEMLSERRRNHPVLRLGARSGAAALPRRAFLLVVGMALTSLLGGLGTTPFALYHFQRMAPLSILANVAAMPLTDFLIMPFALLSVLAMPFGLEALPLAVVHWGINGMLGVSATVARWSGQSGGAAMPGVAALLLFVAGFVWLALWRERWRLLGIAPMLAGIALALSPARPELLVSADGRQLAIRGADGTYRILARKQDRFVTDIWLRSDGDERDAKEASVAQAVGCDAAGCVGKLPGGTWVALALDRAAFEEDCRRATLVVTPLVAPERCARHAAVIDRGALERSGSLALWLRADDGAGVVPDEDESVVQNSNSRKGEAPPIGRGPAPSSLDETSGQGGREPPLEIGAPPSGDNAPGNARVDAPSTPAASLRLAEARFQKSGPTRRPFAEAEPEPSAAGNRAPITDDTPPPDTAPSRYDRVERNADDEDVVQSEPVVEPGSTAAGHDPRLGDRFEVRTAYAPVRRPWMPAFEPEPADQ
ncbi:MAG: ComEC/Rec2 family competence protein [Candidatus Kaistia colombiensis]|nr:MAG: ComEC/Rec2 family competence protein [Kaistia sp.]